jgi:hypothetical protein
MICFLKLLAIVPIKSGWNLKKIVLGRYAFTSNGANR